VIGFFELGSSWDADALAAIRAHYTGSDGPPPGKKAMWRIVENGRHRGWLGLGEPAFKLAPRRRLGLEDARPLAQTVCCFIYRLDGAGRALASHILRAWHPVAAVAWAQRYGQPPVHWETMVDPCCIQSAVPGACFRRAGYRSLGLTTGRTARRPAGHSHGPRLWADASPKLVLYRGPLARIPTPPSGVLHDHETR
jgi:hypothetical protein